MSQNLLKMKNYTQHRQVLMTLLLGMWKIKISSFYSEHLETFLSLIKLS